MSNCTECIPQAQEPCRGKRVLTDCIVASKDIPNVNAIKNQTLTSILENLPTSDTEGDFVRKNTSNEVTPEFTLNRDTISAGIGQNGFYCNEDERSIQIDPTFNKAGIRWDLLNEGSNFLKLPNFLPLYDENNPNPSIDPNIDIDLRGATLPITVNGNLADENGNIQLEIEPTELQDLQSVMEQGSIAILPTSENPVGYAMFNEDQSNMLIGNLFNIEQGGEYRYGAYGWEGEDNEENLLRISKSNGENLIGLFNAQGIRKGDISTNTSSSTVFPQLHLRVGLGDENLGVDYQDGKFIVTDDFHHKGLEYKEDYSDNYTNRSIVDKGYINKKASYSITETLTGGTWIDGKPIYTIVKQTTDSDPPDIETRFPDEVVGEYTILRYTKTTD